MARLISRSLRSRGVALAATFLVLAALFPIAGAIEVGDTVTLGAEGEEFVVERQLGGGYFGVAWLIRNRARRDALAMKVYKDHDQSQVAFAHYNRLFKVYWRTGYSPNLLHIQEPKIVHIRGPRGDTSIPVILSEVVDGSLADQRSLYSLTRWVTGERVQRLFNLMHDIAGGVSVLYELGVSHYDITPRNIFLQGSRHKLGDLDSVAPVGHPVAPDAWESLYAPVEYSDGGETALYSYSHLGDAWALGAVLLELMTGKSPLEHYLAVVDPESKLFPGADGIWAVRRAMGANPIPHTVAFRTIISRVLEGVQAQSKALASSDKDRLRALIAFVESALLVDLVDRENFLRQNAPFLRIHGGPPPYCGRLKRVIEAADPL